MPSTRAKTTASAKPRAKQSAKPTEAAKPKAKASPKPKAKASAKTIAKSSLRARKLNGEAGVLERFREICLALPETTEVEAWGHPTFRVTDKIFASAGADGGPWHIGMKATYELQAMLVENDPRFSIAKYVGKHGWVTMRVEGHIDWKEIAALVEGSYRLIAPKALVQRLGA